MTRGFALYVLETAEPEVRQRLEALAARLHGPPKKPADYRDRTRRSPQGKKTRSSADHTLTVSVPGMRAKPPKSRSCVCVTRPLHWLNAARRRPVMSVDVSEDSVELIEAVVADHQLAFAADRMLDRNLGAQLLRQLLFQAIYIGIARRGLFHPARR